MPEFISVNDIIPNQNNPRKNFKQESLEELAQSIKEHGIIQPLVVKYGSPGNEGIKYMLICGERRLRAAKMAGLEKVPVVFREMGDPDEPSAAEALKMLVENLQREDLDPIEEAAAYRRVLDEFEYSQEELAGQVGKSQGHIANRLRLLELPETVRENISRGIISASHGKVLAGHKNLPAAVIEKAVETIANDNVPVAKADNLVLRLVAEKGLPLFDNYRKKPEFKSGKGSECYDCENRAMGKDMYVLGDNEQPFCLNPECWERKQEEALQKKLEKAQKAGADDDTVDVSKLNYNQYEYWSKGDNIHSQGFLGYDQSECFDCEHRKRDKKSDMYYCLDPACMRKKRAAKTKAENKVKKDAFQAELGQIAEMVKAITAGMVKDVHEGTYNIGLGRYLRTEATFGKPALIYIAAQVLANVSEWHDRKVTLYKYLQGKFGWDHDVLKRGAWGILNNDWDTFRPLLESLDERQLLETIFEWPAVARGLKGAEGWFLSQAPKVEPKQDPEQVPARRYLDKNGRTIFVSSGLWSKSGETEYGTFWESARGGRHRVKTQAMPMVPSREDAQRNLDAWAEKNGLQPVDGDGQCGQPRTA